ncbi:MAG: TatD family hydrolase [Paramuribaculum sp.]|nr:TatD family hydrolase [Paramuribaculum sp.]
MSELIDCHTHNPDSTDGIICVSPDFSAFSPGKVYSVGIHPWDTSDSLKMDFQALERSASHEQVVAIGESGLDRLRGASLDVQTQVFVRHIELSEFLRKPLIVHCVRCSAELLGLRRRLGPVMPWIYHGFSGKPELARQLTRAGILLSFGERGNVESFHGVPSECVLLETDNSSVSIDDICALYPDGSAGLAAANLRRIFGGLH